MPIKIMKKKDWKQLKSKSGADLQKQLSEDRDKLWQLKVDLAAGKVKNVREIRATRKNVARVLTLIKQEKNVDTRHNLIVK